MSKDKILIWDLDDDNTCYLENGNLTVYSKKYKRFRATTIDNNGYARVKIMNRSERHHRIVATKLFGEMPEGLVVNHKNGVKTDNSPENLEYITQKENIWHAKYVIKTHVSCDVTRMPTYKDGRCLGDKRIYKRNWQRAKTKRLKELQNETK